MRKDFSGAISIRKVVSLYTLGKAGFQSTLYSVACKIVCPTELTGFIQNPGFSQACVRKTLQVKAIHLKSSSAISWPFLSVASLSTARN